MDDLNFARTSSHTVQSVRTSRSVARLSLNINTVATQLSPMSRLITLGRPSVSDKKNSTFLVTVLWCLWRDWNPKYLSATAWKTGKTPEYQGFWMTIPAYDLGRLPTSMGKVWATAN